MIKKTSVHYVDNKKLYGEMIHFTNACKAAAAEGEQRPKVPEYIGYCIYKIATRLAVKPNFASYTYKDEMIADGIEICIRYIHNFDPEKSSNPSNSSAAAKPAPSAASQPRKASNASSAASAANLS